MISHITCLVPLFFHRHQKLPSDQPLVLKYVLCFAFILLVFHGQLLVSRGPFVQRSCIIMPYVIILCF